MDNFSYLFAAYTVIWAILFIYVFVLAKRQSSLKREIENLKNSIKPDTK